MRSHVACSSSAVASLLLIVGMLGAAVPRTEAAAPWLDPSWGFRMPITVDAADVQGSGDLLDFPLLLRPRASESSLYSHAKSDGSDLVVTKGDGVTVLAREIVSFDPGTKRAEIWVRADSLSKTANQFYVYYGNPDTALAGDDGSAWRSAYLGVYHFSESPGLGILKDHGPNGNNATVGALSQFSFNDTITGPVGQAWKFNGTTHWVNGDAISSSDSSFTISAWFGAWNQLKSGDADFAFGVENPYWHLSSKRNNNQRCADYAVSGRTMGWNPIPLPDTLSHQYVWTMDGEADTIRFYYDGVEQTPWLRYSSVPGAKLYTGVNIQGHVGIASPIFGDSDPYDLADGVVDEFRVMEGVEGPDWVTTQYRTQALPGFATFGAEEPFGTTAVHLLSFQAEREPGGARIWWETPEDAPQTPIDVYREDGDSRIRLNERPLWTDRQTSFLDATAPTTAVRYWLADLSRDGAMEWVGPVVLPAASPAGLSSVLGQNRPNPFRSDTRIRFLAGGGDRLRLQVFDAQGRRVATLLDGVPPAGENELVWKGTDDRGRRLAPGIYFYRLETPTGTLSRRMVLVP